ncbi:hypothetical protein [Streptomyces sp. NPDC051677]|uniref:hypothetical protein n=1 Tax=Streptomyces sp. NPDC051677 TaxID=3365669 RepID=UPI0037D1F364
MTPWQRALCGMRLGAVGALGVVVLPYGAVPSYAAVSAYGHVPPYVTVSASATPVPSSPETDRAGSRAGEGRERPGRKVDQREDEDEEGQDTAGEDTGEEDSDEGSGDAEAGDGDGDLTGSESPQAVVVPATSATPQDAGRQSATQAERADGPVLQILPLGTGLVLIGLGIALALAALRLRRG